MSRWTDLAVWRPSNAHGGGMVEHRGIVLHIAEGFYEGTIAWQHDPGNKVSSHFVVGRAGGQLAQVVDTDVTAWTQRAGNGHWLSIEFEGFTTGHRLHPTHLGWERLSDWQLTAAARILARAHHQYGVPLQVATSPAGRGVGHHSMGGTSWGHLDCPGAPIIGQKHEIIERAGRILGTPTPPAGGKDEIMSKLPTRKSGDSGAIVKRIQVLANLCVSGPDIAVDGEYGPATIAQVKRAQSGAGITADGVCGPDTWCVLLGVPL